MATRKNTFFVNLRTKNCVRVTFFDLKMKGGK